MPEEITIPKVLKRSSWDKTKGTIAKIQKTGIGDLLDKLNAASDTIDWPLFNPRSSRKWTVELIEKGKKAAEREFRKFNNFLQAAQAVHHKASEVEKDWKKSIFIPENSRIAAGNIATAANELCNKISGFRWDEAFNKASEQLSQNSPEPAPATRFIGYTNEFDISKSIKEIVGEGYFGLDDLKISIAYGLPDMGGKENPYVAALIGDAISGRIQNTVRKLANLIKKANKDIETNTSDENAVNRIVNDTKKAIAKEINELNKALDHIPHDQWKEYTKAKKQYKEYIFQSKKKVAKASFNIFLSSLKAAASAPTGPVAIIKAIVGVLPAIAKLGSILYNLAKEAETAGKSVDKTATKLLKEYTEHPSFFSTINLFIDTAGVPFLATATKLNDDFTLWNDKTAGLHYNAGKIAKSINPILERIVEIDSGKNKKLEAALKKLEDKLDKVLKAVTEFGGRYQKNSAGIKKIKPIVVFITKKDKEALGAWKKLPQIVGLVKSVISLRDTDTLLDGVEGILNLSDSIKELNAAIKN